MRNVDHEAPRYGSTRRPERRSREGVAERTMRTCPVCGQELTERKCKLICPDPRCGYFLSCSDFY